MASIAARVSQTFGQSLPGYQLALRLYISTKAVTISTTLRCCLRGSRRTSSKAFCNSPTGSAFLLGFVIGPSAKRASTVTPRALAIFGSASERGGLIAPFPERDGALRHPDELSEFDLCEPRSLAEGVQMRAFVSRCFAALHALRHETAADFDHGCDELQPRCFIERSRQVQQRRRPPAATRRLAMPSANPPRVRAGLHPPASDSRRSALAPAHPQRAGRVLRYGLFAPMREGCRNVR